MADNEDTGTALRRLEAALNRIAAHVARPRPPFKGRDHVDPEGPEPDSRDEAARHEIVTKLDDLIGGLRDALGLERQS